MPIYGRCERCGREGFLAVEILPGGESAFICEQCVQALAEIGHAHQPQDDERTNP